MTKRKTHQTQEENMDALEAHLAGTLKRVSPSQALVQRLQGRLQMPTRREITLRLRDWNRLFFIFGGVMSGMLLLVTLARAFYYLAGNKSRV
jgi:anti-sigma factor RsiW